MLKPVLVKQLEELVEDALIGAAPGLPIRAVAEGLIQDNSELIDQLMKGWRLEYVSRLLRRRQAYLAREQRTAQLMLPGFERLPGKITVSNGSRKPLGKATFRQLREYLAVLRKRQSANPRIGQVQNLIALMQKWRKKLKLKNSQGLTVAEVMRREADA